jgi:hypothetical protein
MWGVFVSTPEVSKSKALIKIQTKIKNEYLEDSKCEVNTKIVDG